MPKKKKIIKKEKYTEEIFKEENSGKYVSKRKDNRSHWCIYVWKKKKFCSYLSKNFKVVELVQQYLYMNLYAECIYLSDFHKLRVIV